LQGLGAREIKKQKISIIIIVALLVASILGISPLPVIAGVRPVYTAIIVMSLSVFMCLLLRRTCNISILALSFLILVTAAVPSFFWQDFRLVFVCLFLLSSVFLCAISNESELSIFIDIATWLILIMLVGGLLALVMVLNGAQPITSFPNPDGRTNYVFFLTFTNTYKEFFIRPAGIYDEPGAFSLVICMVAVFRHLLNKSYLLTWLILIMGFITFSLMHLVFVLMFALSCWRWTISKSKSLGLLVFALIFFIGVGGELRDNLLSRISINPEGRLSGDNRSGLMLNAANILLENPSAVLWGIDIDCTFNYENCKNRWGRIGENPLSPLVHQGLFVSWPYYLVLLALGYLGFVSNNKLIFLAVILIFLQRPYVLSFGYSLLAVLPLLIYMKRAGD